jgi:hypothetical protein
MPRYYDWTDQVGPNVGSQTTQVSVIDSWDPGNLEQRIDNLLRWGTKISEWYPVIRDIAVMLFF